MRISFQFFFHIAEVKSGQFVFIFSANNYRYYLKSNTSFQCLCLCACFLVTGDEQFIQTNFSNNRIDSSNLKSRFISCHMTYWRGTTLAK